MTNVMQTASRLALIATLSAAPAALLAQSATTTEDPAATEQTATDETMQTETESAEGEAATEMDTDTAEAEEPAADTATDTADSADPAAEETTDTADAADPAAEEATDTADAADPAAGEATDTAEAADPAATDDMAATDTADAADPAAEAPATDMAADSATEPMAEGTEMAEGEEAVKPVEGQIVMQSENTILAEDLLGSSVYSENGESIGDINNLIVNLDGTVEGVVIGVGGFLGIGEKDVAIEMASLTVTTDENANTRLMTSSTKADLEAAEAFVTAEAQQAAQTSLDSGATTDPNAMGNSGMATQPAPAD